MKIVWLGQAGLLFDTGRLKIIIDPYLSDNMRNDHPGRKRRVPINTRYLHLRPNVIVCTNDRPDHMDAGTLNHYLTDAIETLVLGPDSCISKLRLYGGDNTYVRFNPGTEWTLGELRLRAVYAEHSDPHAIGVVIHAEGRYYYAAGSTLYNDRVLESLPDENYEAVFLPICGYDDQMNAADATRMAARIRTRYVVPYGFGMFDTVSATDLLHPGRVIPQPYKPLPFCRNSAADDPRGDSDVSDEPWETDDGNGLLAANAVRF